MVISQECSLAMLFSLRDKVQFERLDAWHFLGDLASPDRHHSAVVVVICQFGGCLVCCLTTDITGKIAWPSLDDLDRFRLGILAGFVFEVTSSLFTHIASLRPGNAGKCCTEVHGYNDIFL
jgi:hypothetical protein